jgi:phosphomannomutase
MAVIPGGGWPQFQKQVLAHLSTGEGLKNLSLLPTCGTKFFQYGESWNELYLEDFTTAERTKILAAQNRAVDKAGNKPAKVLGAVIEDRGSQITFSALGQQVPLAEKSKWDPDFKKREAILAILKPTLRVSLFIWEGRHRMTLPSLASTRAMEYTSSEIRLELRSQR